MASTSKKTLKGGQVVTIAELETVDLAQLEAGNSVEIEKMARVAQNPGFFYLDLQNSGASMNILNNLSLLYSQAERYFDQPKDIKAADVRLDQRPSQDRGYKFSDCDETFEVSYNELVEMRQPRLPDILQRELAAVVQFSESCHAACLTVLSGLSRILGVQLQDHHRPGHASDSGLKYVYEPALARVADVVENRHTDSGTLTMLFYKELGLHINFKDTDEWAFVVDKPGCSVVNVADSLKRLSNGTYHSPTHRVTQPCDGFVKRYYLSYFLRPEQELQDMWANS